MAWTKKVPGVSDEIAPGNVYIKGPRPWAEVRAHGAVANGVADDGPAWNAARAALPSTGGVVSVAPGAYLLTTAFTFGAQSHVLVIIFPGVTLTGAALPTPSGTNGILDLRNSDLVLNGMTITADQILLPGGSVIGQFDTSGMQIRAGTPIAAGRGPFVTMEQHATGGAYAVKTSNAAGTADIAHLIIPGAANAPVGADDGVSVDIVDVAELEIINSNPGVGNVRSSPQLSLVGTHGLTGQHQWQERADMLSAALSVRRARVIVDGVPTAIYTLSTGGLLAIPRVAVVRTAASLTTAGDITLTAAQLLDGMILRNPNGASRADTLPTAALLVAAMPGAIVGSSVEFTIRNTAGAAETITVGAGAGGTTSGTMTIVQNNTKRFLVRLDNVTAAAEAYTVYSLGTVVH